MNSDSISGTGRQHCIQCERPINACYCHAIIPINNRIKLTIIQDEDERAHPLNTARIVELGFSQCDVISSEYLLNNDEALNRLMAKSPHLLFPAEDASIASNNQNGIKCNHVIVIDSTWRRATKILHQLPTLLTLDKVAINPETPSRYKIRKAQKKGQLATLEAVVNLYDQIEPTINAERLYAAMNYMIEFQIEKMGDEIFRRNYGKD